MNESEATRESRFMRWTDPRLPTVAGLRLPRTWWSRPFEYAWASLFSPAHDRVLDAGCGVSHPFKWALSWQGDPTIGVDLDARINSVDETLAAIRADFGPSAPMPLYRDYTPRVASITDLPFPAPCFARVFCISVLEHMHASDRARALAEFARVLRPDGLAVLTVDVPACDPAELLDQADAAGLVPAGWFSPRLSPDALPGPGGLRVFRLLLRHGSSRQLGAT